MDFAGEARAKFVDESAGAGFEFRGGHANHSQSRNFVEGAALIGAESCFQSGDGDLVDAQGAKERIAPDLFDEFFSSCNDARLRAAEQFVSAEADDIRAGSDARAHDRFADASGAQVSEAAGAQILENRDALFAAKCGEFGQFRAIRESDNLEI